MENIKSFSFKRILLLMQKTLYENAKSVIIGLTTVFGLFSFILIMSALNNGGNSWDNLQSFYIAGLYIAGFFISGMAFSNFRNKEKTLSYLTLPASTLEKFISEWLLTTFVFIIGYTVIFYVFNFLLLILGNSFSFDVNIINVFNSDLLIHNLPTYFIIQSIFLAGAATFKKSPFFKTIFASFLFAIFITIYLSVLAYFLKGTFESFSFNNNGMNMSGDTSYSFENHWLIETAKIMYYYISAPAFWLYTYFKLKEKEA